MKIRITEDQLSILNESFDIQNNANKQEFEKEVKLFIYNLISNDSHEQIQSRFWQLNGYKKYEVINLLNKFNVIVKDNTENRFKVPKQNFERKINRLYSYLFPENQQSIAEDGEGGGDIGGGNSSSSVGGSYEAPFSGVIRRKIG